LPSPRRELRPLSTSFTVGETPSPMLLTNNSVDFHYAEGTLMTLFVLRFICISVPERAPWFIRWFVSMIFKQLRAEFVDVEIKKNTDMVNQNFALDIFC
jgi:hypothetical protein